MLNVKRIVCCKRDADKIGLKINECALIVENDTKKTKKPKD